MPERARVYCHAWLAIDKFGEGWEGVVVGQAGRLLRSNLKERTTYIYDA